MLEQIQVQKIQENLIKTVNNKYDYASPFLSVNFLSKEAVNTQIFIKKMFNEEIDRSNVIVEINTLINDINASILLEAGIYESALLYSIENDISVHLMSAIYKEKTIYVVSNFHKSKQSYNPKLIESIKNREIDPQTVAFLPPQEIHHDKWKALKKKKELRDYKKNNMAATDLYKCYKCGERRCQVIQMQTRSADEPMTNFITCLVCFNEFKI